MINKDDWVFYTRAKGISYLMLNIWIKTYPPIDFLLLFRQDESVYFLPKYEVKKTLQQGLAMIRDSEKFNEYVKSVEVILEGIDAFSIKVRDHGANIESWREFVGLTIDFLSLYRRTEWFYTDLYYKEDVPLDRRSQMEQLKQKMRGVFNSFLFVEEGVYMMMVKWLSDQLGIGPDNIHRSTVHELDQYLVGEELVEHLERDKGFGIMMLSGERTDLKAEEAFDLLEKLDQVPDELQEIKGVVANKGKARAKVTIIPNLFDDLNKMIPLMDKMPKGNILVAPTTSPELTPALKKASAVVTDEGGLGSHAAIVSREMGIPCIVGTKIATQVLEDGDEVEVDADEGVVRIITKKMI